MPTVGARQPIHTTDRSARQELRCQSMRVDLERCLPTNRADQVVRQQSLIGLPAAAGPHQPFAPRRAVPPVVGVAGSEGQSQGIVRRPHRGFLRPRGVQRLDAHARARGDEPLDVESLANGIGSVPAVRLVVRWQQHVAGRCASRQDGLRG